MLQPARDSITGLFKKPAGSWDSGTCLIQNKPEVEKCAACETPRPKPKTSTSSATSTAKVNYSFTDKCFYCLLDDDTSGLWFIYIDGDGLGSCPSQKHGVLYEVLICPTQTPIKMDCIE